MSTLVFVIAEDNFRDEEYLVPKLILENHHVNIITASTTLSEITGKLGHKLKADMLLKDISLDKFDGIIFIGGGGATQYFNDELAHRLAQNAFHQNKICGAICIAPVILANAGLLHNKNATVFVSEIDTLKNKGALYLENDVVVDGNLITANGPSAAHLFGEKIYNLLKKS